MVKSKTPGTTDVISSTISKPKLLLVTTRPPVPALGGDRLRILMIAQSLCRTFDITLLSISTESINEIQVQPSDVFKAVEIINLPRWKSIVGVLKALVTGKSLQLAYYDDLRVYQRVQSLADEHEVILAHLVRAGQFVQDIDHPAKVLEMTDAISLNYDRITRQKTSKSFKELVYVIEAKRALKIDLAILPKFHRTFLISDIDKDWLREKGAETDSISVYTAGLDLQQRPVIERAANGREIIFVGNMTTAQNLDAAWHFVNDVFPLIQAESALSFKIIGVMAKDNQRRFNKIAGVTATGEVTSIQQEMKNALCGVCMLRIGAGVQNKVLEYLAAGLPAVVNDMAYEGLTAVSGQDLIVAKTPQQQADAILDLAKSPQKCQAISVAGRKYVEHNHHIDAVFRSLNVELMELVDSSNTLSRPSL